MKTVRWFVVGSALSASCDWCGAVAPVWIVSRRSVVAMVLGLLTTRCSACFFAMVASGVARPHVSGGVL